MVYTITTNRTARHQQSASSRWIARTDGASCHVDTVSESVAEDLGQVPLVGLHRGQDAVDRERHDGAVVEERYNKDHERREVEFEGKRWRLSPLTKELYTRKGTVNKSGSYQGAQHWAYDGIKLADIM